MADEHLILDRIVESKQSVCCHAGVHTEDNGGCTCWFVCDECGRACDLERAAD